MICTQICARCSFCFDSPRMIIDFQTRHSFCRVAIIAPPAQSDSNVYVSSCFVISSFLLSRVFFNVCFFRFCFSWFVSVLLFSFLVMFCILVFLLPKMFVVMFCHFFRQFVSWCFGEGVVFFSVRVLRRTLPRGFLMCGWFVFVTSRLGCCECIWM